MNHEPKEWSLPDLPEGFEWYRSDGWSEKMLPPHWRPFLKREMTYIGDVVIPSIPDATFDDGREINSKPAQRYVVTPGYRDFHVTHRPLPDKMPWQFPDPPNGYEWLYQSHEDWHEWMLPEGWRPLLFGESTVDGDKSAQSGCLYRANEYFEPNFIMMITQRPLPEPKHP